MALQPWPGRPAKPQQARRHVVPPAKTARAEIDYRQGMWRERRRDLWDVVRGNAPFPLVIITRISTHAKYVYTDVICK